jgi:DNA topoisomerase I
LGFYKPSADCLQLFADPASKLKGMKHVPPSALLTLSDRHQVVESLRYVTDQQAGYSRRGTGKRIIFFDCDNNRIRDEAEIARIRKLAIPPAYKHVWICPYPTGHLQATGIDAKGRKQYRYHAEWRRLRDTGKFDRLMAFGEALPHLRETLKQHMAQRGLGREKVLATVVSLLEKTLIRVGNDEYARDNQSYGLTTLQNKHIALSGQTIRFMFKGKSGKTWQLKVSDRRIAAVIKKCEEIEGQELFKYRSEDAQIRDITSGDVNRYLHDISDEGFTAKDFRTWAGTVHVAAYLKRNPAENETQAKRLVAAAIEDAAKRLGNTPAICRKCYVHPYVITSYLEGKLDLLMTRKVTPAQMSKYDGLTSEELQLLSLLRSAV